MKRHRMVFLHGLEGSPRGNKALWFKARFDATVPDLETFEAQRLLAEVAFGRDVKDDADLVAMREAMFRLPLARARDALGAAGELDFVAASSFGAAVLLELMHLGEWTGPALLIAGAGVKLTAHRTLPPDQRVLLIHGRRDEVVPLEDSRLLAASGGSSVQLWEVGDDHRLRSILDDGTLEAGIRWLCPDRKSRA